MRDVHPVRTPHATCRVSRVCSRAAAGIAFGGSYGCLRSVGSVAGEEPLERQFSSMPRFLVTEQAGIVMKAQQQTIDFERELCCVRVRSKVSYVDCQPDGPSQLITPSRLLTQHVLAYWPVAAVVLCCCTEQHAAALMNTRPFTPSLGHLAQPRQSTRLANRRSLYEFQETGAHRLQQRQLQLLFGPEMGKHSAFGHAGAQRHRPNGQALESFLARQPVGASKDQLPRGCALLGGGSRRLHGSKNSTNVRASTS